MRRLPQAVLGLDRHHFHGTKVPVRTWVFVVFEMCASKNGFAAREIRRKYGLTGKSAWFVLHHIREAMKQGPLAELLTGRVVSDEAFYGGKPANRHGHDPVKQDARFGGSKKTPIQALVSRETGEIRSVALPSVTGKNLRSVLSTHRTLAEPTCIRMSSRSTAN